MVFTLLWSSGGFLARLSLSWSRRSSGASSITVQPGRTPCRAAKCGERRGSPLQSLPWAAQPLQLHSSAVFLFSPPNPAVPLCLPVPITSSGAEPVSHVRVRWESCLHFCCLPCTPFKACRKQVHLVARAAFELLPALCVLSRDLGPRLVNGG